MRGKEGPAVVLLGGMNWNDTGCGERRWRGAPLVCGGGALQGGGRSGCWWVLGASRGLSGGSGGVAGLPGGKTAGRAR